MKRTHASLVAAALLIGTAACVVSVVLCSRPDASCAAAQTPEEQSVEAEDCDTEDWINREDDCGFSDTDRRKRSTPAPRTVPQTKRTRR